MDTIRAAPTLDEVPYPVRRRDWTFYLALFCFIGPLWATTSVSWIYVLWTLGTGSVSHQWHQHSFLLTVAVIEALFSIYHRYLFIHVCRPRPVKPANLAYIQKQWHRVLQTGLVRYDCSDDPDMTRRPQSPDQIITKLEKDDPRAIDFRHRLRTWYSKVPWNQIRRTEVMTWLHWSIYGTPMPPVEQLSPQLKDILEDAVQLMEDRTGTTIPAGSNPAAKPIQLTLDPVIVSGRPVLWYAFVAISNAILKMWFRRRWGAKLCKFRDMEYMVHIPKNWTPASHDRAEPIVFYHGLGLGLFQYSSLLSHLMHALPDRPLLVPIQPHISQDIFHPRHLNPMEQEETTECLYAVVKELGWVGPDRGVTFLSHSNGSVVHAWVCKAYPEIISRSCFVDPVAFCLWEGDVCHNFLYQTCVTGVELVMRYVVGMELGVANLLQRHFDWSANTLWLEEVPNALDPMKTAFFVGGADAIVDSQRVKKYLTDRGIRNGLFFNPNGRHGQALLARGGGIDVVVDWIQGNKIFT